MKLQVGDVIQRIRFEPNSNTGKEEIEHEYVITRVTKTLAFADYVKFSIEPYFGGNCYKNYSHGYCHFKKYCRK